MSHKNGGLVRSESGAGSIVAVAIMAAVLALTSLSIPLYMVVATKAIAAGAADAAALAAADVSVGLVPGVPCDVARVVATANGANLTECLTDGLVLTVGVTVSIRGFAVPARATAGPPRPTGE